MLGNRFKEHLKAPTHIYNLYNITDKKRATDNFSIVGRVDQSPARTIESVYIRINGPSLNKNIANTICYIFGMMFHLTPL